MTSVQRSPVEVRTSQHLEPAKAGWVGPLAKGHALPVARCVEGAHESESVQKGAPCRTWTPCVVLPGCRYMEPRGTFSTLRAFFHSPCSSCDSRGLRMSCAMTARLC